MQETRGKTWDQIKALLESHNHPQLHITQNRYQRNHTNTIVLAINDGEGIGSNCIDWGEPKKEVHRYEAVEKNQSK